MSQRLRLPHGGRIDRQRRVVFHFDGRRYEGFEGDTAASALLAHGVRVFGRSFKYHRPRGVFGAGVEEPNALLTAGAGGTREPNLRATQIEIHDGLELQSQNRWPSLGFDVGALAGSLSPLLPAGFYYKTFMWPRKGWLFYEWFIRRAAGLGRASTQSDPDRYAHKHATFDVVVVGAGPSGLAAALTAGKTGARVLLVEDMPLVGGSLLGRGQLSEEDRAAHEWLEGATAALTRLANVTVVTRTTAFGYYDHNTLCLSERVTDHLTDPDPHIPRHRMWYVRAREVVLAAGALERPLVFGGNDRPGIMLASAARRYLNQYAVAVGQRLIGFTNNDSIYPGLLELVEAGVPVPYVIDTRPEGPSATWGPALREARIEVLEGQAVVRTRGRLGLRAVDVRALTDEAARVDGKPRWLECDGLLVSGGWTPTVHLYAQAQGKLEWCDGTQAFVPGAPPAQSQQRLRCAGGMTGTLGLAERIDEGAGAGVDAARAAGFSAEAPALVPSSVPSSALPTVSTDARHREHDGLQALWLVPSPGLAGAKRFVDLQNDVTADDVALAAREGYRSVEHLKRYTTLGMGTDQGRSSNLNGLANLALVRGESIPDVGLTTYRPPFSPVSLGALAGEEVHEHLAPYRLTPLHDWHVAKGAKMITVGRWMRPESYPRPGETTASASYREAAAVRAGVGIVDVSTLGKIELQGPDAGEFLERVYMNRWRNLKVGRGRYGLMLRDDGMVLDDGTTTRLGDTHYYMTTTTGEAEEVMGHLEYHARVSWPSLDVDMLSVSDQWGALAVAGPQSRALLADVATDDVNDGPLPFMGYLETTIAGVRCRVFRITFSGERAYEVHMPAGWAETVWREFLRAGERYGVIPYGTEAMAVLRIEKGHVVASEIDGRTTPGDLGFAGLMRQDGQFIGHAAHRRPGLSEDTRLELVGLRALVPYKRIPRGGHIIEDRYVSQAMSRTTRHTVPTQGHITSLTYSPALDAHVALGLLRGGRKRIGEGLVVAAPLSGQWVPVEVVSPVFLDPEGSRPRG